MFKFKSASLLPLFLIFSFLNASAQLPVLAPAAAVAAKMSEKRLDRIDAVIRQYIDSGWIKGAAGFIARDGRVVYNKSFGFQDAQNSIPLRNDAIFRIASQTKAITSVALMTLFEEGKFLLDDPISKYIPEFAKPKVVDQYNEKDSTYTTIPARREITIRDLLTHTSGVDYAGIGSARMRAIYAKNGIAIGLGSDRFILGNEIRKLGGMPLQHQPGERFTYGLNTDILGYLVEILSGVSLDEYFRQRIFTPLGMNDTYFYLPESKHNRLATVFTEDRTQKSTSITNVSMMTSVDYPKLKGTFYSGGGGLSSTIKDYAIFLQMLLNGGSYNGQRILGRHTVELMTVNQIGDLFVSVVDKFGLGFQVTTERGQAKSSLSEGSFLWGGYFGTSYWVDPKEGFVCLLFIQQSPLSHGDIQGKFKNMVYQAIE